MMHVKVPTPAANLLGAVLAGLFGIDNIQGILDADRTNGPIEIEIW